MGRRIKYVNIKSTNVAEMVARNEQPDILFWVGCSGSFETEQKNTRL